jgi:hypothetical protein
MKFRLIIAGLIVVISAGVYGKQAFALPAAQLLCAKYMPVGAAVASSTISCAIITEGDVKLSEGQPGDERSWTANIATNTVDATYLSSEEASIQFSTVFRWAKPRYVGYEHFSQVFVEDLLRDTQISVQRNKLVSENLDTIKIQTEKIVKDMKAAHERRLAGQGALGNKVRLHLADVKVAANTNKNTSSAVTVQLKSQLATAPSEEKTISLTDIPAHSTDEILMKRKIDESKAEKPLVGQTSFFGPQQSSKIILTASIESEKIAYSQVNAPAIIGNPVFKEGQQALKFAALYTESQPGMATALYWQAVNARAYASGTVGSREVAAWDNSSHAWTMQKPDTAAALALPFAYAFNDIQTRISENLRSGTKPASQRPADSIISVTERMVSDARASIDTDPVKSLNGLFRARTLSENAKLYGGTLINLNKWVSGASKNLRDSLTPLLQNALPGEVYGQIKNSIANYSKAIEAGDYAVLGLNKVGDMFGSEALTDLSTRLVSGKKSVETEPPALPALDGLAPTLDLWIYENARAENEENSKREIVELTKLRNTYLERAESLNKYAQRIETLDELTHQISAVVLDQGLVLVAGTSMFETASTATTMGVGLQLEEVSQQARQTAQAIRSAEQRYREQAGTIDQMSGAWMMVLPKSPIYEYKLYGSALEKIIKLYSP